MPKATKVKKPQTTEETPKDEALDTVLKDFNAAWEYCKGGLHDRWMNNYKLYHGQRTKRGYDGITDTFVPMAFSTVETKKSALYGGKPKFNFLPPKEKQDQKTDILNAVHDYYWEKDQWSVKTANTGTSKLQIGVGVDYFYWHNDHPVLLNVPLRDFFIDPTATSLENARYMGRRYLTTKEELEKFEIVDWENPVQDMTTDIDNPDVSYEMKPKYKNLDKLEQPTTKGKIGVGSGTENTDKQEKDIFYGSTLTNSSIEQIEVIEWWTEDKTVSIANRMVVIEDTENYYKAKDRANGTEYPCGIMPFNADRCYIDPALFYAKGEIDFLADQQELLNDITNQNIDSITFALNQMYTLDPEYAEHIETVENLPGAVYPFRKDALVPIQSGQIPAEAFNERMNIKNEIRETTASNEVVKGVGEAAGGKATATEINAQVAGSGQRMGLMITQMENEYFHRMARIILAMIRLYVTEPMLVRIVGQDGARWEEFDPAEFKDGEYEPRVQLDIAIENQKAEDAANAKELMTAFLNDPDINQVELKKLVLAKGFKMEPDEVDVLMQPMQPPMGMVDPMTGMPLDPMAQGMQPPIPQEDMMLPPQGEEMLIDPTTGMPEPAGMAV